MKFMVLFEPCEANRLTAAGKKAAIRLSNPLFLVTVINT